MTLRTWSALQASPMPTMPPAPAPMPAPAPDMGRGQRPLGVTILSVLDFLGGIALFLGGLTMIALGSAASFLPLGFFGALGGMFVAFMGVFMIVFALVFLVMGWGLWTGQGWAWTLGIILALLGVLMGIVSLPTGIVTIAIEVFLIWYFTREGVQRWFGKVGAWPAPQVNSMLGSSAAK
ncbi:MAG TPA: hypothetical protein VGR28_07280 [Candidatus Thermoplasmatota archaeon]|jgi:hypothetical protein|nr:hypothetical protein [Candidatus Thermoplasmatota archaeon]